MSAPVFVVTGMHRSGTSCMMGCLVAGGMRGNYSTGKDNELTRRHALVRPDYEPNPKGFFEGAEVPLHEARGMVTKRMLSRFPRSLPGNPPLKAVVMWRNRAERAQSLAEWDWPVAKKESWLDFERHYRALRLNYPQAEIVLVDYADLVREPATTMRRLTEAGWPIVNLDSAAAWVDPILWRHKAP